MSDYKYHGFLRALPNMSRMTAKVAIDNAPDGWAISITPPTRSMPQNAMLWPLLDKISKKVDWYGQKLTDEEWKDVLTAALKREKVVPGINGGFVVLGQRTSKMNKKDFSELLELTLAFGVQHGVDFSEQGA